MNICPNCKSEFIHYSKKYKTYFCEDCGYKFDSPEIKKGFNIFISYGHDDNEPLVKQIKEYLTTNGVNPWIDSSNIPLGSSWREQIINGLLGSNGVISFLSEHSMRSSSVCLDELRIALCMKHAFIQTILLENLTKVSLPALISHIQRIDMSDWTSITVDQWDSYFNDKMQKLMAILNCDTVQEYSRKMELLEKRLGVFDNNSKQLQILRNGFIGRKWLTQEVQNWFEEDDNTPLMIFGVPGAGKSAFAANIAVYNPNVIAFLQFDWNDLSLHQMDNVIRLLAYKLAASLDDYRTALSERLSDEKSTQKLFDSYSGGRLFDILISELLFCCIDDNNRPTQMIIFDGLDETNSDTAEMLFRKVSELPKWIKVLFTSRYDEATSTKYSSARKLELFSSSEENYQDIRKYFVIKLNLPENSNLPDQLAERCEGSFIYATCLCDAIEKRKIEIESVRAIPAGINDFYNNLFQRFFPDFSDFKTVRPFLELLVVGEELPEVVFRECLHIDVYDFWKIRTSLSSMVISIESKKSNLKNIPIITFVHKTIKDWLCDKSLSGEHFIDKTKGFERLAELGKRCYEEEYIGIIDNPSIFYYCKYSYPKWLIMGKKYKEYESLLLSSFDTDDWSRKINQNSLSDSAYYTIGGLWQFADLLPLSYPLDVIKAKITEIVIFPRKEIVSCFFSRSRQITAFFLREIMRSGRFNFAFILLMQGIRYDGFFRSRASDDAETRDGWDKYYMTRDVCICLKECDKINYPVPDDIRQTCERMKLSYHYYHGKPFIGCGEELYERELTKDLCILSDEENEKYFPEIKIHRSIYNTGSLASYLSDNDERDIDFIKKAIENLADLQKACERALEKLRRKPQTTTILRRIEFIQQISHEGLPCSE